MIQIRGRSNKGKSEVVDQLDTIGLVLGPYRNLTTLTASILSLHPQCQVLNHAAERILTSKRDFLSSYSDDRLRAFCSAAMEASTGGRRGDYGGSILYSHAFESDELKSLYENRYGQSAMKDSPTCLIWKESQFVTDRIREVPGKIEDLVANAPKLRFLLPVRQPLDCAMSNLRTGHALRIGGAETSRTGVLEKILETTAWFGELQMQYPDRFFMFLQNDDPKDLCIGMSKVLEISDDEQWESAVRVAYDIKGRDYQHHEDMYQTFESCLEKYFDNLPEIAGKLRSMVSVPGIS